MSKLNLGGSKITKEQTIQTVRVMLYVTENVFRSLVIDESDSKLKQKLRDLYADFVEFSNTAWDILNE